MQLRGRTGSSRTKTSLLPHHSGDPSRPAHSAASREPKSRECPPCHGHPPQWSRTNTPLPRTRTRQFPLLQQRRGPHPSSPPCVCSQHSDTVVSVERRSGRRRRSSSPSHPRALSSAASETMRLMQSVSHCEGVVQTMPPRGVEEAGSSRERKLHPPTPPVEARCA